MEEQIKRAKELRKNMTPQERKMWAILRNHNFYNLFFRRQYPIGNYIVDFVCRSKKIIIEIDGGQHNEASEIDYDNCRTKYLETKGYRVFRFWNNEIDNNIEGVYERLLEIFGIK